MTNEEKVEALRLAIHAHLATTHAAGFEAGAYIYGKPDRADRDAAQKERTATSVTMWEAFHALASRTPELERLLLTRCSGCGEVGGAAHEVGSAICNENAAERSTMQSADNDQEV